MTGSGNDEVQIEMQLNRDIRFEGGAICDDVKASD